ncbi:hypothetical protein [Levilactobacillus sp. N40-8-2]|uniref:hypothetical protein n=1 Tax=Levilactobacillus muriae TaxID=3238987 RepID=UPI0038B378B8
MFLMKYKRRMMIGSIAMVLVIIAIGVAFLLVPNTPQNAVRLTILKNGHPVIALTETPQRLTGSERLGYSGKMAWRYYSVKKSFDASNGWINIDTLAVNKPKMGSKMYRVHVVHDVV